MVVLPDGRAVAVALWLARASLPGRPARPAFPTCGPVRCSPAPPSTTTLLTMAMPVAVTVRLSMSFPVPPCISTVLFEMLPPETLRSRVSSRPPPISVPWLLSISGAEVPGGLEEHWV